jgi:hypothetical protein
MKTTKILAALLGFLLMANSNVALAQDENTQRQDSIYGLEMSYTEDGNYINLSFYSTYNMNEITEMWASFFKYEPIDDWSLSFPNGLGGIVHRWDNGILYDSDQDLVGIINVEQVDENVYRISNKIPLGSHVLFLSPMEAIKAKVWLEGESSSSSGSENESTRSSSVWKSNILTFYYDPQTETSLMQLEAETNYEYKYFLLSGIESETKPMEIPFIQVTYKEGSPIAVDKRIEKQ